MHYAVLNAQCTGIEYQKKNRNQHQKRAKKDVHNFYMFVHRTPFLMLKFVAVAASVRGKCTTVLHTLFQYTYGCQICTGNVLFITRKQK